MPTGIHRYTAMVLFGSAAYLYLNLFTTAGIPFLLDGDQVYFWTYGLRILHGQRIYQDFFTMHPPGTALFYASLFALFGERVWVTNLAVLVLGVALCWMCFRIASRIMDRRLALLAACLFLTLVYGKMLNGTHHWLSVLAVMGAVAVLLPDAKLWRIVVAGSLLGVASFFTQTRGPFALLGIAAFLVWDWRRSKGRWPELLTRQLALLLPFVATLAILSAYFIATTGAANLWYFQITYVRQHMVKSASLGLPESPSWHRLPTAAQYLWLYVSLPIAYALSLYRCARNPAGKDWRAVALLALVGLCLFAEVALSINWLRVFVVSMPGIILIVLIFSETKTLRTSLLTAASLVLVCLALTQTWSRHTRAVAFLDLPAGRVAARRSPTLEKLTWLANHTKPDDFFFQAAWTSFYLPLKLRNPVFLDLLEPSALSSPQYVDLTIHQLETAPVRYILWSPRLNAPNLSYGGQEQYHLAPFRDYLQNHYHLVWSFSDNDQLWERNSSPG